MTDEIMNYKNKLEAQSKNKPIWKKKCLTIEEAAAYSGIGVKKLRQLTKVKKCPFVVSLGTQIYIVREKLEDYTNDKKRM